MAGFGRGTAVAAALAALLACSDRTRGEGGRTDRAQGAATGDGGQLGGQPARPAPAELGRRAQEVDGTLTHAAADRVVIRSEAQGDVALRLDDRTRITVDGQPASPDRLAEGVEVRASYDAPQGGGPTATFIEAESAADASSRTVNQAHGNAGASPAGSGLGPGPSPAHGGHDVNAGGERKE